METPEQFSFYPGYYVARIGSTCWLCGAYGAVALDHTNEPIYCLNERGALNLTPDTVCAYVRFLLDNTITKEGGRFIVVEPADLFPWIKDTPEKVRREVMGHVRPMITIGINDQGMYAIHATIMFNDALFLVEIYITPDKREVYDPINCEWLCATTGQIIFGQEEVIQDGVFIHPELWMRGLLP